jgi:hypothetical protein
MGFSRYMIRSASQCFFGARAPWTYPDRYLGLFTATPTGPDDAGVEASVGGYARRLTAQTGEEVTDDWGKQPRSAVVLRAFEIYNTRTLPFGPLAGETTITGFGLWDAGTGGNLLVYGALTAPLTVPAGRSLAFPVGALRLSATDWLDGPLVAHIYLFPQLGYGPPTLYQPAQWLVYPLTRAITYVDFMALYTTLPAGYATLANDTATWPLVGSDVTNGVGWSYAPAEAEGPDITHLLFIGKYTESYAPYWIAALAASATVRVGERLEIAAGCIAFDGL